MQCSVLCFCIWMGGICLGAGRLRRGIDFIRGCIEVHNRVWATESLLIFYIVPVHTFALDLSFIWLTTVSCPGTLSPATTEPTSGSVHICLLSHFLLQVVFNICGVTRFKRYATRHQNTSSSSLLPDTDHLECLAIIEVQTRSPPWKK